VRGQGKGTNGEVPVPMAATQNPRRLQKLINDGSLYNKDPTTGQVVKEAEPLPTSGPFHVSLCTWRI
jgi:hypothetical protein